MKLVEQLAARAAAIEEKLGKIADREMAAEERHRVYHRLGQLFDQMAADGRLDAKEIGDLKARFRALGLPTDTLDSLRRDLEGTDGAHGADVTADLRTAIQDQLRDADLSTRSPGFLLEVQTHLGEYQETLDLASRVSKTEHEAYMTSIRHLVA